MTPLTTKEAENMITMLKHYVDGVALGFPDAGGKLNFSVIGETRSDKFAVSVYRQRLNETGGTFQGRTENSNIVLMRLDVNPTAVHQNPDGEKICGTHLHIYNEEYGDKFAVPFDTKDKDLFQNCLIFLNKFNIVDSDDIIKYYPQISLV